MVRHRTGTPSFSPRATVPEYAPRLGCRGLYDLPELVRRIREPGRAQSLGGRR